MTSVHHLMALLGLLGAGACVMGRLTGPVRDWAPPAVVLAVMALMVCGVGGPTLAAGAGTVAALALWTALAGQAGSRGTAVVDLATMAVLTACASRIGRDGAPGHRSAMHMSGAPGTYDIRLFLLLVVCWALARAGVRLTALVRTSGPPPTDGVGAQRVAALQEGGSVAMVVAMAAMLA
ncbi:hypothetical protein ACIQI8_28010 [Streptomyces sp. NPDC092369]|uniref:hypothetical protein n=1 Tax=Streptomyces sp. NPDC092369 TaxID=3366015 RepID=UPI0038016F8F